MWEQQSKTDEAAHSNVNEKCLKYISQSRIFKSSEISVGLTSEALFMMLDYRHVGGCKKQYEAAMCFHGAGGRT